MQTHDALHESGRHIVQFYDDSDYLCEVVAEFLHNGLSRGDPALLIATEPHRERLIDRLRSRGFDVDDARGRLTIVDAQETLDRVLSGGSPDPARFDAVIGSLIEGVRGGNGATVRAFGEMVDLLWRGGNPDGAIELESLWNELAERYSLRLLCAYAMDDFASAADARRFDEICRRHDRVAPTERFTDRSGDDALLRVSQLQQRERALESELSGRRRLEERLRAAIRERDALLRSERAARTQAEAASRARSDFLAVMSHELRTPLNAISGYAELLDMGIAGPLAEPQREMLGRIRRSQRHLLSLIDEVLTFTRSEQPGEHTREDVRMADVLQAAELSLLPQMQSAGLTYAGADCDDSILALADPDRVRQIVINLLANATKYTPHGGTVRMECRTDDARVYVRVIDDGIGIPAGHVDGIFEPFYQVDGRLTRSHAGLGLGLAISRRFARAMGGDLSVDSTEGKGSVFTLTLPRSGARHDAHERTGIDA